MQTGREAAPSRRKGRLAAAPLAQTVHAHALDEQACSLRNPGRASVDASMSRRRSSLDPSMGGRRCSLNPSLRLSLPLPQPGQAVANQQLQLAPPGEPAMQRASISAAAPHPPQHLPLPHGLPPPSLSALSAIEEHAQIACRRQSSGFRLPSPSLSALSAIEEHAQIACRRQSSGFLDLVRQSRMQTGREAAPSRRKGRLAAAPLAQTVHAHALEEQACSLRNPGRASVDASMSRRRSSLDPSMGGWQRVAAATCGPQGATLGPPGLARCWSLPTMPPQSEPLPLLRSSCFTRSSVGGMPLHHPQHLPLIHELPSPPARMSEAAPPSFVPSAPRNGGVSPLVLSDQSTSLACPTGRRRSSVSMRL